MLHYDTPPSILCPKFYFNVLPIVSTDFSVTSSRKFTSCIFADFDFAMSDAFSSAFINKF